MLCGNHAERGVQEDSDSSLRGLACHAPQWDTLHNLSRTSGTTSWLVNKNTGDYEIVFAESCAFMWFGAMDVTKPYEVVWLGDIHGLKPSEFMGFRR